MGIKYQGHTVFLIQGCCWYVQCTSYLTSLQYINVQRNKLPQITVDTSLWTQRLYLTKSGKLNFVTHLMQRKCQYHSLQGEVLICVSRILKDGSENILLKYF